MTEILGNGYRVMVQVVRVVEARRRASEFDVFAEMGVGGRPPVVDMMSSCLKVE